MGEASAAASVDLLVLGLIGELDPSFGDDGFATSPQIDGVALTATTLIALDDGSLLVGGEAGSTMAVVKFTAEGEIDTAFGDNGVFVQDFAELSLEINNGGRLGVQSDGRIILSVWGTDDAGQRSAAFAVNGEVTVTPSGADVSGAVNMFPIDDSLTVVGLATFTDLSSTSVVTCRFDLTGTLDESLGDEGVALTSIPNGAFPTDAVLQGGIRYVTANNKASTPFFLMRLFL